MRELAPTSQFRVFVVCTPEHHVAFSPFLSTHFSPCLNPIFKNGSFWSVVSLVSVALSNPNPRLSSEKGSNLAPTPSSPRKVRQLNFPSVKNEAG